MGFVTAKDTKFLRDKHNVLHVTAPASGTRSVFNPQDVSAISAFMYASATAIRQRGRQSGLYAKLTAHSAGMIPPGQTGITGYTPHVFIAQVGSSDHLMSYPAAKVSAFFANGDWSP